MKLITIGWLAAAFLMVLSSAGFGAEGIEKDTISTSAGDLEIYFLGHASLMMKFGGKVIYIDPVSSEADFSKLPPADIIFLTHGHRDHMDPVALQKISRDTTKIIMTAACAEKVKGGTIMNNDEQTVVDDIEVEAVPAYNIIHKRDNGEFYHPKGVGNGYVLIFGGTRVYLAGDTENTPEMKALRNIDVAFLPMNLPYTMTPEMVADAALAFRPKILYPYHYGKTNPKRLVALLKHHKDIEVRIRKME